MTTNTERAIKIIDAELAKDPEVYEALFGDEPAAIIYKLQDDNLMIPDPPEPHTVDRYPGSACWEVCTDPSAAARRHVGVRVDHMSRIKVNIVGEVSPAEAREAAYALIAAANYEEQEQDNE